MGQSTDALLFYGYMLGDPDEGDAWSPDQDDIEWGDKVALAAGIVFDYSLPYEGNERAHQAYWKAKREAVEAQTCDVVYHCSGDYPMYGIAIKSTHVTAYRGSPKKIEGPDFNEAWLAQLAAFAAIIGAPAPEEDDLGWWLASYWG